MRRRVVMLCSVVGLVLAACGGDDGGLTAEQARSAFEETLDEALDEAGEAGGDDSGNAQDLPTEAGAPQPPLFRFTGAVDAPADWAAQPATCLATDTKGLPFFSYMTPGAWRQVSFGYGGGGFGGSGSIGHDTGAGTVEVELDEDAWTWGEWLPLSGASEYVVLQPSGSGEPWTTWNYDITSYTDAGESTESVFYTQLDQVEVDGQLVDLWYLDQSQSELLYSSEFRARLVWGDVPTGGAAGRDRSPASVTITFNWDATAATFDEAMARELLATFRLGECAQNKIVEFYEIVLGTTFPAP